MGEDNTFASNESWQKTVGPWFVYLNNVPASITDASQANQALYTDAQAQAAAESAAWPYQWCNNPHYTLKAQRGTVTGKLVLSDPTGTSNPVVKGTWVGLEAQPNTNTNTYDFQEWAKTYPFWTTTDSAGNFTIPNVIPGSNYTLYAYGPGMAGTFMSQQQTAMPGPGLVTPPLEVDLPSTPFGVAVPSGGITNLGSVTWTEKRVGSTVFEIGYPDRKADKFRHSEDYWSAQLPPQMGYPTGIWGGEMYFPWEFPNDTVNYTVGQSRWQTDWNYVLPSPLLEAKPKGDPSIYGDAAGNISFNLAAAPGADDQASIYIGCASDDGGKVIVEVNSTPLDSSVQGTTAEPNPISSAGFNPPYQDDSSVHSSDHGPFSDERITFPASLLHAGTNTVTIINDSKSYAGQVLTDYIRLELTNYVPPPPASVTAYPGNNQVLVTWPAVPGATRYALLRSTTPDSGYAVLPGESGILGTVSGSGPSIMKFTDVTATNGPNYYYEVESLNPTGTSAPSVRSGRATPSTDYSSDAPEAPTGLSTTTNDRQVNLYWTAGADVSYCNVYRTTLHSDYANGTYPLATIMLQDHITPRSQNFSCTDNTPSDGTTYTYYVVAVSPAGTSGNSASVTATPMPPKPANAPSGLTAAVDDKNTVLLNWTAVPNATGYAIYRTTTGAQPVFPTDFIGTSPVGSFEDSTAVAGTTYHYQVTAENVAGISGAASLTFTR